MSDLGNKRIMAQNILYYMNLNDKSRQDMCDALGVKYTTFTDWVKGNTYPRIDKIELMANYFNISKSDLVEERKETVSPPAPVDPDADAFIEVYKNLDSTDRTVIKATANTLLNADKYKKDTGSSSA